MDDLLRHHARLTLLSIALLLGTTAISAGQAPFSLTMPGSGDGFYPSDTIRFEWPANPADYLVHLEVRPSGGVWRRLTQFESGSSVTKLATEYPPGTYEARVIRTRRSERFVELSPVACYQYFGALAFSPDGEVLAVLTCGGKLSMWAMKSGLVLRSVQVHDSTRNGGGLPHLRFSSDGQYLLASSTAGDPLSIIVRVASGEIVWSWSRSHIDMSADASLLAIGNRLVRRLDSSIVMVIGDTLRAPGSLWLSPGGRYGASINGASVDVWSTTTGRRVHTVYPHYAAVILKVVFNDNGEQFAAVTWNGEISVFETATGRYLLHMSGSGSFDAAFSRDGQQLVVASLGNRLHLLDPNQGTAFTGALLGSWGTGIKWESVAISPVDSRIAAMDDRGRLRLLDVEDRIDTTITTTWHRLDARLTFSVSDSSYGRVSEGGTAEQIVHIRSEESVGIPWTAFEIRGPDASAFTRSPGKLPVGVHRNAPIRSAIFFRPLRSGFHECTVHYVAGDDTLSQVLTGIGARQPIVGPTLVDLGQVPWNSRRDTVVAFARNVDSVEHHVALEVVRSTTSLIRFVEGFESRTLAPGEQIAVHVRFDGSAGDGLYEQEVTAGFDDVGSPLRIVVRAQVVGAPMSGAGPHDISEATSLVLRAVPLESGAIRVSASSASRGPIDIYLYTATGELSHRAVIDGSANVVELGAAVRGTGFVVARDRTTGVVEMAPVGLN